MQCQSIQSYCFTWNEQHTVQFTGISIIGRSDCLYNFVFRKSLKGCAKIFACFALIGLRGHCDTPCDLRHHWQWFVCKRLFCKVLVMLNSALNSKLTIIWESVFHCWFMYDLWPHPSSYMSDWLQSQLIANCGMFNQLQYGEKNILL